MHELHDQSSWLLLTPLQEQLGPLFSVVYFNRGTLPTKKGVKRALLGDLDNMNMGPMGNYQKVKVQRSNHTAVNLGVGSPFFSAIVLCKNQQFPQGF